MRKILSILILYFFCFQSTLFGEEKKIELKFKVNDDLITNYDIIRETKYLKALNKKLETLDQDTIYEIAKNSLIREKIKQYEVEKFYTVNYSSETVNAYLDNFMENLNISSLPDFENYLEDFETSIEEIRRKLVIEQTWNKLIFDIYKTRILVNEKKITETLEKLIDDKKNQKSYELYEIVFSENNKQNFDQKYKKILLSIKDIGFKQTASIYSISSTANLGGKIGWVNQNQLSKKFLDNLTSLEIGSFTEPINSGGGSIIIMINDIKEVSVENIDKEIELSKLISAEKNRQLNEFSIIHFKKIENKSYVKKF